MMPAIAPPHTMHSSHVVIGCLTASRAIGVTVPAMRTKIMEWSSWRMRRRAASDQVTR